MYKRLTGLFLHPYSFNSLKLLCLRIGIIRIGNRSSNCHKIGYAPRRHPKNSISPEKAALTNHKNKSNVKSKLSGNAPNSGVSREKSTAVDGSELVENFSNNGAYTAKAGIRNDSGSPASKITGTSQCEAQAITPINCYSSQEYPQPQHASVDTARNTNIKQQKEALSREAETGPPPSMIGVVLKLKLENICLRESLKNVQTDLQFEKDKNMSLQSQLQEVTEKMQKMDEEQEVFVSSFLEERSRRNIVEENLKKSLKVLKRHFLLRILLLNLVHKIVTVGCLWNYSSIARQSEAARE